jgi:hypothetical protein
MWRREGRTLSELARDAHRRFADGVFGPGIGVYNGVAVPDRSRLDSRLHFPNHKAHLVAATRQRVSPGDEVAIVGGGRSVVAVHAVRAGGEVTVYEGGREAAALARRVADLNSGDFRVVEAIVGDVADGVRGETDGVGTVAPESLSGDVLVLDCEGAELGILPVAGFETVIVETHPSFDAPTPRVREALTPEFEIVDSRADPVGGDVLTAEVADR